MEEKRWRLVVKPGPRTAIMWPLLIVVSVYSLGWENLIATLVLMCITVPCIIYCFMSVNNERIVVYTWGIVEINWLGKVKKARFEEITVIEIYSFRRGTIVSFFAGDIFIAKCPSENQNFSELMKFITVNMPEKIQWCSYYQNRRRR